MSAIFLEAQRAFAIALMLASDSRCFMVEIVEFCPSGIWSVTINILGYELQVGRVSNGFRF